jgi:hypothetical protein
MVYFQTKIQIWVILEGLLVSFMDTWSILQPFDICYRHLVYFYPFGTLYQKIWQHYFEEQNLFCGQYEFSCTADCGETDTFFKHIFFSLEKS